MLRKELPDPRIVKIAPELNDVLWQLLDEGARVYSYTQGIESENEINSLFWFDDKNKRVLNIQPTTFRNRKYNRDCYSIGVSYWPSRSTGSGCALGGEWANGLPGNELLKYREFPTWVKGIEEFTTIDQYLNRPTSLTYFEVTREFLQKEAGYYHDGMGPI